MGKMKRNQKRLHIPAVKTNLIKPATMLYPPAADQIVPEMLETEDTNTIKEDTTKSSLFSGLNIDPLVLSQKLPVDFDARSTLTNKSLKGLNLKKKEKQKLKHDTWMKKIDDIQTAKKREKEKKRRQKTAVVGDMSVIEDALPTLELLMKGRDSKKDKSNIKKLRGIEKEKTRQKQMMTDIALFKEVLEHPAFKEDPSATISEHLTNKLKQEEEME